MKLINVLAIAFIALLIIGVGTVAYAYFLTANIALFLNGVLVTVVAGISLIVTLIIRLIVEAN